VRIRYGWTVVAEAAVAMRPATETGTWLGLAEPTVTKAVGRWLTIRDNRQGGLRLRRLVSSPIIPGSPRQSIAPSPSPVSPSTEVSRMCLAAMIVLTLFFVSIPPTITRKN
jgi:hypothetical protein